MLKLCHARRMPEKIEHAELRSADTDHEGNEQIMLKLYITVIEQ